MILISGYEFDYWTVGLSVARENRPLVCSRVVVVCRAKRRRCSKWVIVTLTSVVIRYYKKVPAVRQSELAIKTNTKKHIGIIFDKRVLSANLAHSKIFCEFFFFLTESFLIILSQSSWIFIQSFTHTLKDFTVWRDEVKTRSYQQIAAITFWRIKSCVV